VGFIEVDDTLYGLGEIARHWRGRHPAPLLAITGSNGKTTTKEMVAGILSRRHATLKNSGNLNNRIGLPLTLLDLRQRHGMVVLEMGMNEPGEIRRLAEIARPQWGLITQVAPAHLQGLGSLEGVARAKGELFEALGPGDTAVVNLDDPWVARLAASCRARRVTFGEAPDAQLRAEAVDPFGPTGARWVLRVGGERRGIAMQAQGTPMVRNGLAAAAGAWAMGMDLDEIVAGLEGFRPFPGRLSVVPLGRGMHLIDDAYNANPASMAAALELLCRLAPSRRVAVLGEMRELGDYAEEAHREIGREAARLGVTVLVAVGSWARTLTQGALASPSPPAEIHCVASAAEALELLRGCCADGDWVLVKGSRGMAMERVVEGLRESFGEGDPARGR
jgi:UDP-N-acetylmuramoyl-tripeptide--D-alanyl-D-alanine ligase